MASARNHPCLRLCLPVCPPSSTNTAAGPCQLWSPWVTLNKCYVTSLQSNWEKSEGPFSSIPSPGLRKKARVRAVDSGRVLGMASDVYVFQGKCRIRAAGPPSRRASRQWGPVSMGLRVGTAAAGERCHGHPRQAADPPPAHSFSNPGQDHVLHSHSIADIQA